MKVISTLYAFLVCWFSGWTAGRFDFYTALMLSVLMFLPLMISIRIKLDDSHYHAKRNILLPTLMIGCLSISCYLVTSWLATGVDGKVIFQREFANFKNFVQSKPEYKNVLLDYTFRKGNIVSLDGKVLHKYYHDELLKNLNLQVRYLDGINDNIDYPHKELAQTN